LYDAFHQTVEAFLFPYTKDDAELLELPLLLDDEADLNRAFFDRLENDRGRAAVRGEIDQDCGFAVDPLHGRTDQIRPPFSIDQIEGRPIRRR